MAGSHLVFGLNWLHIDQNFNVSMEILIVLPKSWKKEVILGPGLYFGTGSVTLQGAKVSACVIAAILLASSISLILLRFFWTQSHIFWIYNNNFSCAWFSRCPPLEACAGLFDLLGTHIVCVHDLDSWVIIQNLDDFKDVIGLQITLSSSVYPVINVGFKVNVIHIRIPG